MDDNVIWLTDRLPKDPPAFLNCKIEVFEDTVSLWLDSEINTAEQYNWVVARICDAIAALLEKKRGVQNGDGSGAA